MIIQFYLRFYTTVGQELLLSGLPDNQPPIPMTWFNNQYWFTQLELEEEKLDGFSYHYQLKDSDGKITNEWGRDRQLQTGLRHFSEIQVVDTWNHAGSFENAFYTAPFQETLLAPAGKKKLKLPKEFSHIFRVKAPLLKKNEVVCLTGAGTTLGDWATEKALHLQTEGNWWTLALELPKEDFPLQYKYGIYNTKTKSFVQFETGENRQLFGDAGLHLTIVHDGFLQVANTSWKGAGVAIPVFSLRSKNSWGIGEFTDLEELTNWARSVDMKLIQLLPVNDTSATHTWVDSYPYAAISAFALHPIFINLDAVAGKKFAATLKPYKAQQKYLNELPSVDYEAVLQLKLELLKQLFDLQKESWQQDKDYLDFFTRNQDWLVPYAAFCYLRDENGSADFTGWATHSRYNKTAIDALTAPDHDAYPKISFHYFLQYQLHTQLKKATEYAHKNGIIVKGDIPIGIYRYSCDAWVAPELYNMDQQAGAPPDDFAIKGQNWGFPTYNWQQMQKDGFAWWKRRFAQMSDYFDAFRIDHILGFFRIWSIPYQSTEGIMGRFVPAIAVHKNEFQERGIWFDHIRYTYPYITEQELQQRFGELADFVKETFLEPTGYGQYFFQPKFDTQRKIEQWFTEAEVRDTNNWLRQGLYDLHSNRILFEEEGSNGTSYHFRFGMEQTSSFQTLEWDTQQKLKDLYINYFFRRQDNYWMEEAMQKLPALKASTNMLICGEDLGMVPACVPEVMNQLGILSLEIQRMPKNPDREFFHPDDAPYLSVVTPSTHDMSTIRGWWEEDRAKTQRFFNKELGQWGEAPVFCEAWINKQIIIQHLHSPAMWSIFQLQDLLGGDEQLRRPDPADERINVPANPKHYWRYRMHLPLEQLIKEKTFNQDLKEHIKASGRA
ncbi:4-alpha-glucanotransferase [Flavihumibacter sp. CACIAM 22H1]|uniref:4-alpha-glucanotransferase n=1 Tax=Flavihumibacter sp. CACIAM 22H1 TaxID=1812911 RepID=UPI0007A7C72A|nr:4-alpha-glucanotransferase [Flavihumibacter sp. CACIAM 22H1]KYP15929.1 MAG: 4-alpha-glucanotransferase [Flavihumibacter sp. CACIAM 22H1]